MTYYWLLILNCKKLCLRNVMSGLPGAYLYKEKSSFWTLAKSRIILECIRTSGLVPQSQTFYIWNLLNMLLVTFLLTWCKLQTVSLSIIIFFSKRLWWTAVKKPWHSCQGCSVEILYHCLRLDLIRNKRIFQTIQPWCNPVFSITCTTRLRGTDPLTLPHECPAWIRYCLALGAATCSVGTRAVFPWLSSWWCEDSNHCAAVVLTQLSTAAMKYM